MPADAAAAEDPSSAHRQISATTVGQYSAMATWYRQGTWNHDVSQNIQTLLAAVTGPPPYRILDLGCGPGRDLVAFRDLGHVVVGLDAFPMPASTICRLLPEGLAVHSSFERHRIEHLSASSLNLWAAEPALWVMERLLGRSPRGPPGPRP